MSWSAAVRPAKLPDILDHIDATEPGAPVAEEGEEQLQLAKKIAKEVIQSGAVGSDDKYFQVNLGGHANPNHEPADGWSNDTISVNVSQAATPDES